MTRRTLAALFVTTGATALLAEQAYEKLLEALVGTTTHAAATVLTIYFAGLTIGGFTYRWWRRLRVRPLMLYAGFEAGIGLWALVLYAGFEHLISVFVPLLRLGGGNLPLLQFLGNTDRNRWIEYDTPRYNFGHDLQAVNLRVMHRFARPSQVAVDPAALPALTELCSAPQAAKQTN